MVAFSRDITIGDDEHWKIALQSPSILGNTSCFILSNIILISQVGSKMLGSKPCLTKQLDDQFKQKKQVTISSETSTRRWFCQSDIDHFLALPKQDFTRFITKEGLCKRIYTQKLKSCEVMVFYHALPFFNC